MKHFLTSYVSLECLINSCDSCDTLDHITRIDFTKNFRSNVLLLWFSFLDKLTQTLSSVTIRLLVVPLVIRCIQSPLWLYIFLLTTALDNLVWRWVILEMTVIFLYWDVRWKDIDRWNVVNDIKYCDYLPSPHIQYGIAKALKCGN